MSRYKRDLERRDVRIEWVDPDHDWPTFRVVRVWPNRRIVLLRGIAEGGTPHAGDEFLVWFEEIRKLRVLR